MVGDGVVWRVRICKDRRNACSSLSLPSSSAMQCACANDTAPVGILAWPMRVGVTRALTYRCVGSSCRMTNDSFLWSRCCSRSTCRMYCRVGMSHDSSIASSTAMQLMQTKWAPRAGWGRRLARAVPACGGLKMEDSDRQRSRATCDDGDDDDDDDDDDETESMNKSGARARGCSTRDVRD